MNESDYPYASIRKANVQRMHGLRGSPHHILEVAQASYMDFLPAYGDPLGDPKLLEQADMTSATSGVLNKLFGGRVVYSQLNTKAPTWGSLPHSQRTRSSPYGWRAKTAFAQTGKAGQSEGTIPTALVSSYFEVAPTIKESAVQMRVSGLHQDLQDIDDAYGALADLQGEITEELAKALERALNTDIDTVAGVNLESIDRVAASSANQATIGWTAGDEDIFGIDRSAQTWADGNQTVSATAVALTKQAIKTVLKNVLEDGGDTTFFTTGFDTWQAITDLYEPSMRFDGSQGKVRGANVGDAERMEGGAINPLIGELYGRPIVGSDQAFADGSELSRLYYNDISNPDGKDKPRLGIDIVRPVTVFAAGERSNRAPQSISFAGDSLYAVVRAEVGCRFFKAQGQLRDRTAP